MATKRPSANISFILRALRKEFPRARTALEHESPFQLLVSTILSAQCTDERVNKVTPELFRRFPDPQSMALADAAELETLIRSTGFFRMKTKNIMACSSTIVERHGGRVPSDFDSLVALPGVGRKTANCVMGGAFGVNSGIVVDTHVQRISNLLGLTKHTDPVKIELDLMAEIPKSDWYNFSNLIILHGRKTCIARRPDCANCKLLRICPAGPRLMKLASPSDKKPNKSTRRSKSSRSRIGNRK